MKTLIKNNKSLFILPLLALPFVVLIFYILGGGEGRDANKASNETSNGANYQLPDADRNIAIMDKKEAYQQIETEEKTATIELNVDTTSNISPIEEVKNMDKEGATQVLMERIKEQEAKSRRALNKPRDGTSQPKNTQALNSRRTNSPKPESRVASNSQATSNKGRSRSNSRSIEFEELEDLLNEHEQILAQKDSMQKQLQANKRVLNQYQAITNQRQLGFELKVKACSGFEAMKPANRTIKAQIVEDSKVMTGNRIMMRLLSDTEIKGKQIKANTLIYGLCKTANERLQIQISSIPNKDSFLPVNLSVYDLDGIEGIYVPDNVARKVYQDVAGKMKPSVLLNPSGDPLTYMGVNTASDLSKNMMKRIRLKKVYLRKNTVVILQNN